MDSSRGSYRGSKFLVANGADVNARDKDGRTSLHLAAKNGRMNIMKYLIQQRLNANEKDNKGKTPLHYAAWEGHTEIVQVLAKAEKADINARDNEGKTPLYLSCSNWWRQYTSTVEFLISKGAKVNIGSNEGTTPLHLAAYGYHAKVARALINAKADINARDKKNRTPLHYATGTLSGKEKMIKLLVSEGADVNAQDVDWDTPLHEATENGYKEIVKFLIEQGANLFLENKDNKTPMDVAKNEKIMLLFAGAKDELHSIKDEKIGTTGVLIGEFLQVNGASLRRYINPEFYQELKNCEKQYQESHPICAKIMNVQYKAIKAIEERIYLENDALEPLGSFVQMY